MEVLSKHDQVELDAFRRLLAISSWRQKELGETWRTSLHQGCLAVYGDVNGEGDKHQEEAQ